MLEWIEIKYRAGKISIDGIVKGNKEEKDYKSLLWLKKYETVMDTSEELPLYQVIRNLVEQGQELSLVDTKVSCL